MAGNLLSLKHIITELTANNQVVVRYVDRANCLPARNLGDMSCDVENEQVAKLQKKVERTYAIVRNASTEYLHDNSRIHDVRQDIIDFYNHNGEVGEVFDLARYKGNACTIPEYVEYREIINGKLERKRSTPHELHLERLARLDIIKKSQQQKRYERSWGKLQTDKSFSRNAKQKILEAGAVIDKHIGNTNAFALTLTIPGSGWDIYDVVSRWSGYIVNRLTQIIRRAEKEGVKAHWFFVWEHQKRGALHMHWCLAVESDWRVANLLCLQLRAKWEELLEELSVKTSIDLFRKRGFSGTWRYSPEVWQNDIQRVKKSVAQYFSKYCSKNAHVDRTNIRRRHYEEKKLAFSPDSADAARVYSLCPTRYWGCARRTKRLCALYRVTIRFVVASPREGDWVYKAIRRWLSELCPRLTEVSRSFEKASPDTGFIFCEGWERKIWFSSDVMDAVLCLFKRLFANQQRKTDAIGAIVDLDYF